jgi:hypothetical protein
MIYILQCAWCEKILGTKESSKESNDLPDKVTHTICPECSSVVLNGLKEYNHETSGFWTLP